MSDRTKIGSELAIIKKSPNFSGHPAYSVSGYPTIFWIKNGDKKNPQKYQGGRTVDDFKKWVADNRSKAKDEL